MPQSHGGWACQQAKASFFFRLPPECVAMSQGWSSHLKWPSKGNPLETCPGVWVLVDFRWSQDDNQDQHHELENCNSNSTPRTLNPGVCTVMRRSLEERRFTDLMTWICREEMLLLSVVVEVVAEEERREQEEEEEEGEEGKDSSPLISANSLSALSMLRPLPSHLTSQTWRMHSGLQFVLLTVHSAEPFVLLFCRVGVWETLANVLTRASSILFFKWKNTKKISMAPVGRMCRFVKDSAFCDVLTKIVC